MPPSNCTKRSCLLGWYVETRELFIVRQLSLLTVLKSNPSCDMQWISQMQLAVTSRAKHKKKVSIASSESRLNRIGLIVDAIEHWQDRAASCRNLNFQLAGIMKEKADSLGPIFISFSTRLARQSDAKWARMWWWGFEQVQNKIHARISTPTFGGPTYHESPSLPTRWRPD